MGVDNSNVNPSKSTYNHGDSVTYTCTPGYQNTGGALNRQCVDTNTWLPTTVPVCTGKLSICSFGFPIFVSRAEPFSSPEPMAYR